MLLTCYFKVVRCLLVTNNILDEIRVSGTSSLNLQLNGTSTIKKAKEEACLINGAACG